MKPKKNKIFRADFLKTSGAALGGVVTLSHYACSRDINPLKMLMIEGKTNYSIVIPKQANWHHFILPKFVTYVLSQDGENYSDPIKVDNPHNPNPAENPDIVKLPFMAFKVNFENTNARFIKVHAEGKPVLPSVIMSAGDTHFMIAEAILKGLASGDANSYYQSGLRKAMAYWETISGVSLDESNMGALTGTTEEKLEKVANQRWIANYTNSIEAWSIVRDTGYPSSAIITSSDDDIISLAGPLNGAYPNRLRYGSGVYNSNQANVHASVSKQGPDVIATKLWFAK